MQHYQFALFLVLFVLALAVSAKSHNEDDDYYYRNGGYGPGMSGGKTFLEQ